MNNYPAVIHLEEAGNTWGCYYMIPGEEPDNQGRPRIHYGFTDLPPKSSLWLSCVGGDAVNQLLEAGIGQVIKTRQGAYGGEKKTIEINVTEMEDICGRYWQQANARGKKEAAARSYCHYCGGQPVIGTDFFGAPYCEQCGH